MFPALMGHEAELAEAVYRDPKHGTFYHLEKSLFRSLASWVPLGEIISLIQGLKTLAHASKAVCGIISLAVGKVATTILKIPSAVLASHYLPSISHG